MARNGVTQLYSATPGIAGQGTALHTWMAANLVQLTVGALYTLSSGVNERNYWTLTFASGAEIMVCCPNGTNMYRDSLYVSPDTGLEGNNRMPLLYVYAPDGGLEAALAAALDPDTSDFVEHVTTTLGLREPTKGIPVTPWYYGAAAIQLHVIEDDGGESVSFTHSTAGNIAGTTYYATLIASDKAFSAYPASDPLLHTSGVIYLCANNTAGPNKSFRGMRLYGYNRKTPSQRVDCEPAINTLPFTPPGFDQIASTLYPFVSPAGKDYLAELWGYSNQYIYRCNPSLVRLTGVNNPRFNVSQGDDPDYEYIKHIQRFYVMWDSAQTPPT